MSTHQHARTRSRGFRILAVATGVATATGVCMLLSPLANATHPAEGTVYGLGAPGALSGSYIVILDEDADKQALAKKYGGELKRTYASAVNGFSASGLSETDAKRLAAGTAVGKVVQNKFHINATQDNPRRGASTASTRRRRRRTRSTRTPTRAARASRRTSSTPACGSATRTSAAGPRTASTRWTTTRAPTTATATARTSPGPSRAPPTGWPRRPRSSPSACWTTTGPAPPSRSWRASTG